MEDMIYDERDEAKIAIFPAIMKVRERHLDLGSAIAEGHRRISARQRGRTANINSWELEKAFKYPDDKTLDEFRVALVDAFLEMKSRLRPDVLRYILDQVRDDALEADEDHNAAVSNVHTVFGWADGGIRYLSEQQEANRRKQAKDRAEREAQHLEAARKRAKNRRLAAH